MMETILLLTKNVLAEERTQKKLQHLNYEVFSSSSLLSKRATEVEFLQFLNLFYYTIISETISDIELQRLLPILRKSTTTIIRKSDLFIDNQQDKQFNLCISNESSLEELRELLVSSRSSDSLLPTGTILTNQISLFESGKNSGFGLKQLLVKLKLSKLETRILNALYLAKNEIVSRDELCSYTWDGEVTNSKLVMLSTLVRKVKEKLRQEGFPEDTIQTHWGRGYQLSDFFYKYFEDELDIGLKVDEGESIHEKQNSVC